MELNRAASLLETLGNPTRLRMVVELVGAGGTGLPVAALQERSGVEAKSTASNHLRQLVEAGLVTRERRSTTLVCRVSHEEIEGLVAFLAGNVLRPQAPPAADPGIGIPASKRDPRTASA